MLEQKLMALRILLSQLQEVSSLSDKLKILNAQPSIKELMEGKLGLEWHSLKKNLNAEQEFVFKSVVALGQGFIFEGFTLEPASYLEKFHQILDNLLQLEQFYAFCGGVIGYYCTILKHILNKEKIISSPIQDNFRRPSGLDVAKDSSAARTAVRRGLENLPLVAMINPIGGAGDRLNLKDESSGEDLPVACLKFEGRSLLEGVIRDLQAKEFLYWKLFGRQLTIPIAMMTSFEKNNHDRIKQLCEDLCYFFRSKENFRFFIQPLVPVITEEGDFSLSEPLTLKLKPGGHGVLWKLAKEEGIFSWFKQLGKQKIVLRQINNPIVGTDNILLAFLGEGFNSNKSMGFISCDRLLNASEGMLVLRERNFQIEDGIKSNYQYCIMNIEYTHFKMMGIQDLPRSSESPYSQFPSNTNILFVDLAGVQKWIQKVPIPGLMINMKNKFPYLNPNGEIQQVFGGRLESMMQSIAEEVVDEFPFPLQEGEEKKLHSFVTYGKRQKVISVTKNQYQAGNSALETPESCFYDQIHNAYDLLNHYCHIKTSQIYSLEQFIAEGPPFNFRYHPALGPLYDVIAQKMQNGRLNFGAELFLELAELNIRNLDLEGSLHIYATDPLGKKDSGDRLLYGIENGKCELINVSVINRGINRTAENYYWKNVIQRNEKLEIILHGNAEFFAKDVCLEGNRRIEIPRGHRMEITMHEGHLRYRCIKITSPTWHWDYGFSDDDRVVLRTVIPTEGFEEPRMKRKDVARDKELWRG